MHERANLAVRFSAIRGIRTGKGRLVVPARCWRLTWYILTVVKKVDWQKIHLGKVSGGLERRAGHLSERRHGAYWIMKELKCFMAAAKDSASTSHGNHVT